MRANSQICACRPLRLAFLEDCRVEEGGSVPRQRAATALERLRAHRLVDEEGGRSDVNCKRCEASRLAIGHPMAIMQTLVGMSVANAPMTARSASDSVPLGFMFLATYLHQCSLASTRPDQDTS